MFQLIVTPQGIEKVTIQLIDTPTKVYAIGARLFLSKVPLEVLQNWVLIQLIVTPHILGKVQGQIKEVCRLIEPCLLIGTRECLTTDATFTTGTRTSRQMKAWCYPRKRQQMTHSPCLSSSVVLMASNFQNRPPWHLRIKRSKAIH